jgi:putative peptidoglycan lipid II flippase
MGLHDWALPGDRLLKGAYLGGAVAGGIALYVPLALLLGCGEVREAIALVRRKILKR